MRPDGGHNICSADVLNPRAPKPKYDDSMGQFCGCCWNGYADLTLWQCDSEWSEKRISDDYPAASTQDLMLLKRWLDDAELSAAEYARLAERGYIDVLNENGNTKVIPYCVILENEVIKANLLAVGSQIKKRHWDELCRLRDTFTNALLSRTPPHLHKARLFGLQHTFFSDPWFILYVLKNLTESGKLKMPTAEQKKMLITIITKDK